jgi:hypothetical protein
LAGEIDAGDLRNALVAHCLAGMTAA